MTVNCSIIEFGAEAVLPWGPMAGFFQLYTKGYGEPRLTKFD